VPNLRTLLLEEFLNLLSTNATRQIYQILRTEFLISVFAGNERNPYNSVIRTEFITKSIESINSAYLHKLSIITIDDTIQYQNAIDTGEWYKTLSDKITENLDSIYKHKTYNLYLYGARKDASTTVYINKIMTLSIIKNTKLIDPITVDEETTLNATEIRALINENPPEKLKELLLKNNVNEAVINIIIREKMMI